MSRLVLLPLAAVALAACADAPTRAIDAPRDNASFSSVHLKGGRNAEISFVDKGLTLQASSALSGLGNGDVAITLTSADAIPLAFCTNPGTGEHRPAPHQPAPVDVEGTEGIPGSDIKNGTLSFVISTDVPDDVGPRPAAKDECPNSNWTVEIEDLAFTNATVSVFQPSLLGPPPGFDVLTYGPLVFRMSCSFPATSNGPVSAAQVECTEVP